MMNVIFLDIDGVINLFENHFDKKCCERLLLFIKRHNFRIVLSSSWRIRSYEEYKRKILETCPELLGYDTGMVTPVLFGRVTGLSNRGQEIESWLNENAEFYKVKCYLILDDFGVNMMDFTDEFVKSRFIHIDGSKGIQDSDIEKMESMI